MCMIRIQISKRSCLFRTPKGAQPTQCTSRAAFHCQNYRPTKIIISLLVTIHRFMLKQKHVSFEILSGNTEGFHQPIVF